VAANGSGGFGRLQQNLMLRNGSAARKKGNSNREYYFFHVVGA